ncbi:MAG: MMPL family transporter [Vicingus serpentipes]|nr:MMPL family transporter [Vicingus serpentipes]
MTKKLSIIIIITIVITTGITGFLSSKLSFDYNFEHFFPKNDADLDYFLEFRETYENDNDYTLIAIVNNDGIFKKQFLQKAAKFSDDLQKLKHVDRIISPTQLQQPIFNTYGFIEVPLLHIDDTAQYRNDKTKVLKSKEYNKTLFSKDLKSICIVVYNTPIISKKASDELLNDIETLIHKYDFDDVHYAGKIRGQKAYLSIMKRELVVFLSISLLLILLLLGVSFRSVFGVIVPIITVFISIIWVLGVMRFAGKSLDIMTSLLPTILFVVGMSDTIHIMSKYLEELRNGKSKLNAIQITFKEIGLATLLTSLTTAIGFITLMLVNIQPIKEFGLYTALGVFLAFVVAILFLPALLSLTKAPKIIHKNKQLLVWRKILSAAFLITLRYPKRIIITYTILLVVSIIGLFQLEINYHLLEDLSDKNPLQQDFRFFEEQYSGIRPFEMTLTVKQPNISVLDYTVVKEMEKVQDYIEKKYGAGFIFSPVSVIKIINKAMHGGNNDYYIVPKNKTDFKKIADKLKHPSVKKMLDKVVRSDNKSCRFSGKMDDVGSKKVNELNVQFEAYFNTQINTNLIQYKMTGTALLVDKNNEFLSKNMIMGLSIAFGLIAVIIGLLYRSILMAFVSLIPNFVPLIMLGGIMGFLGHSINISTSIIFTIAFGIAVDDTIHFLSKFKIEQNRKHSFFYALKRTYLGTGKAIVFTSLILCGGFLSLVFSDFKSTFLIGIYISTTLFLAVITDLLLLPVLLVFFKKRL